MTNRRRGPAAALFFYLALTILFAYPLSVRPATTVFGGGPDTDLFMWTLSWNTYALLNDPVSVFDANMYYPERRTLAYSENLIGSTPFAAPVLWLTGNPVLALNVVALSSCVLCGLGAYVLGRRVGLGPSGALLCGLIFAFSPPRFFRISQAHLTTVQWVPFALASLHAYLDGGRRRDLLFAIGFFTLQVLATGHGAVFLLVAMVILGVYRLAMGESFALVRRIRDVGFTGLLLLVPAVVVMIPYRIVQVEMGLRRTLENWEVTPQSYLASPSRLQVWLFSFFPDARINENAAAYLFPGYLPIALPLILLGLAMTTGWRRAEPSGSPSTGWAPLAIFLNLLVLASMAVALDVWASGSLRFKIGDAVLFSAREPLRALAVFGLSLACRFMLARRAPFTLPGRMRKWSRNLRDSRDRLRRNGAILYGLVTLVSIGLAIGGPLSLWPWVYWLPGLNFIRGPSRFMILAVLGLAVLSGFGFERLCRVAGLRPQRIAVLAGTLLILEFAAIPLATTRYGIDIPGVDRWLASRPQPFVVAEVPVLHSEPLQATYILHSMAHWQKTIHGYSGMRSAFHTDLYQRLRAFPNEDTLQRLVDLGVTYVVVHADLYPPGEWLDVDRRLREFSPWLTFEYTEGPGRVYSLHRPGPPNVAR